MTLDITLNYVTSLKGYDLIFVKVIEPHFCWALNIDFPGNWGVELILSEHELYA